MTKAHGYAVHSHSAPLAPFTFERRELRNNDVRIEILFCGVCHSDLHTRAWTLGRFDLSGRNTLSLRSRPRNRGARHGRGEHRRKVQAG